MRTLNFLYLIGLTLIITSCSKNDLVKPDSESTVHFVRFEGSEQVNRSYILSSGNIAHVGMVNDDAFIMVVTAVGEVKWYKTFGGTKTDYFRDVTEMPNGDIVAVGVSYSKSEYGESQGYVVRMTSNGAGLWEKTYTFGNDSRLYCGVSTSDGQLILGGVVAPSDADTWVLKLTGSGEIVWNRKYPNGPWHDFAVSAIIDVDGNAVFSGPTSPDNTSINNRKFNTFIMKVHVGIGSRMWVNQNNEFPRVRFERDEQISPYPILAINNGLLWATDRKDADYNYHTLIVRTDANGNALASDTFYGLGNFRISSLQKIDDSIYLLGKSWRKDNYGFKGLAYIMKLNNDYEIEWSHTLGSETQSQTALKMVIENNTILVNGIVSDDEEKSSFVFYELSLDGQLILE